MTLKHTGKWGRYSNQAVVGARTKNDSEKGEQRGRSCWPLSDLGIAPDVSSKNWYPLLILHMTTERRCIIKVTSMPPYTLSVSVDLYVTLPDLHTISLISCLFLGSSFFYFFQLCLCTLNGWVMDHRRGKPYFSLHFSNLAGEKKGLQICHREFCSGFPLPFSDFC